MENWDLFNDYQSHDVKNLLAEDVMNEFWIFETDQHA